MNSVDVFSIPEEDDNQPIGQTDVLADREMEPFVVDFGRLLQDCVARGVNEEPPSEGEDEIYMEIRPEQSPEYLGYHIEDKE